MVAADVYGHSLEEDLVHVAPAPVLIRLERLDDGVPGGVEVGGGVPVLRVVAAADVPADLAQAQVHPLVAYPQAVLAAVGARRDLVYCAEVSAIFGYARVSATDQNLATQLDDLTQAGCLRIFQEKVRARVPAVRRSRSYLLRCGRAT